MNLARCPICDKPLHTVTLANESYRPFCSKKCRTVDLGRWLGEAYRIPDDGAAALTDDGDDPPELLPPTGP